MNFYIDVHFYGINSILFGNKANIKNFTFSNKNAFSKLSMKSPNITNDLIISKDGFL